MSATRFGLLCFPLGPKIQYQRPVFEFVVPLEPTCLALGPARRGILGRWGLGLSSSVADVVSDNAAGKM